MAAEFVVASIEFDGLMVLSCLQVHSFVQAGVTQWVIWKDVAYLFTVFWLRVDVGDQFAYADLFVDTCLLGGLIDLVADAYFKYLKR